MYDELEEVIVAVALVSPKPGIFGDDVQHLLVLATPITVFLIGVTFEPLTYLNERNYHGRKMNFDPSTLLPVPTDNVSIKSITGTPDGRIFMGGHDGCVYEIAYEV